MKKYILSFVLLYALFNNTILVSANETSICICECFVQEQPNPCCCNNGVYEAMSKSFMFTHPIEQHIEIEQHLHHHLIHHKKGPIEGALEITAAYQTSIPKAASAHYFLFNCKTELLVSGDDNTNLLPYRDIRAEWLGLPANFSGRFSLCPEQTQAMFNINYNQNMLPLPLMDDFWISIDLPLVMVKNNLNLCQSQIQNPGTSFPTDIIQALNQDTWLFAHINGRRSTVGLAEINIKLGNTYLAEDHFVIDYYSIFSIPSGNLQNPRYTFDPVAGNNGHFGVGAGVNFQVLLNRDPLKYAMCLFLNLEGLFLVRRTEMRTIDLYDKPWSRYLLLAPKTGPLGSTVPGVNVLTRQVRVHPYGMADFSVGLRFQSDIIEFEAGYDLWGHTNELLELRCPFPEEFGIAGNATGLTPADLPPGVYNVTASKSTITNQAENDHTKDGELKFVPIRQQDLDLNSAASQRALNNTFHLAVGVHKQGCSSDFVFGVGSFFEFPKFNGALQTMGVWIKTGVSF